MYTPYKPKTGGLVTYAFLLLCVVGLMVSLRQCSSRSIGKRDLRIGSGDTINVAIELSPMGVVCHGDSLGGVYYDILRKVADGWRPLKFHGFSRIEDAYAGLNRGDYQLVVSDSPITASLREEYYFVTPGNVDRQVLVQLKDSLGKTPLANQFDLGGQKIYVAANSPFVGRLRNLSHEIGDTIYLVTDPSYSSEQLIMLTAIGEIPNVVANEAMAQMMLKYYPQLDASLKISFRQFQGWATKDTLLRYELQSRIDSLSALSPRGAEECGKK